MNDESRPDWVGILPPILESLPQRHVDGPAISVLMCLLAQGDQDLSPSAIAERTDLDVTSVTATIQRLQTLGILLADDTGSGNRLRISPHVAMTGPGLSELPQDTQADSTAITIEVPPLPTTHG
ncbi:MarR family transcriptional regulator [Streptomyces sp. NPDC002547]